MGARGRALRQHLVGLARAHPGLTLALLLGATVLGYLLVQSLWPGERRRVMAVLDAVATAVEAGDSTAVLAHVSPHFVEEGMDRAKLADIVARVLKKRPVTHLSLSVRQLDVERDKAAALVSVISSQRDMYAADVGRSEWLVLLERMKGVWYIRRATPELVNDYPVAGLRSVLALAY
jgi:hypothetical protein